jgi:molecular chaperone DnaK
VAAQDKASGKQQQITVTSSSGLSKDEVDRMVKEAQSHAADDARRREEIEAHNQTDSLAYATGRTFNEVRDKLAENERRDVERALDEARQALASNDVTRMRHAQDRLHIASQMLAAAAAREPAAAAAEQPQPGEVIDAEVVEDR